MPLTYGNNMYLSILFMVGVLGQNPDTHHQRSLKQIRESLNRFDELDKVAVQAKAKVEASNNKSLPNIERRTKVNERIKGYAVLELAVMPPWLDAETSMIDNLVDDACKPYDNKEISKTSNPMPIKQWFNTSSGPIYGWYDTSSGYVYYYQQEQPQTISSPNCTNGTCYGR